MWIPDLCPPAVSAAARTPACAAEDRRTHFLASALLALALTALAAALAPPYVPAPYVLPPETWKPVPYVEPIIVPDRPPEMRLPEELVSRDFIIDPFAEATATIAPTVDWRDILVAPPVARPSEIRMLPDRLPTAVHEVAAEYPRLAMQIGAEGHVVVRALVGADGRVIKATISSSDAIEILELAALEAARRWLFQPAMQGETPVACEVEIPFAFRLH